MRVVMSVFVSQTVYTCICIYVHTNLCICVCSWKLVGLWRVWMKYGSHLAFCPPNPQRHHWPTTTMPSLGHLVRRRWGSELRLYWQGARQAPNQPETLLSNNSTMEQGWVGVVGNCATCAWPSAGLCASVEWLSLVSRLLRLKGALLLLTCEADGECPPWSAVKGWAGVFGECGQTKFH